MPPEKIGIIQTWTLFSARERRNLFFYIIGIMLYKFGVEAFNGSIIALATNRYVQDAINNNETPRTFEKVGLLVGLNQAAQCIGSILIAPLIKQWKSRTVLSISIFIFGLFPALLMIVDAASGGYIKPADFEQTRKDDYTYYGKYKTDGIIPIFAIAGIAYGMVELLRRVIPNDIVGDDAQKLQRMDAIVHFCYELSGTAGAFTTGLVLIPRLGNNYAFIITPICFTAAAIIWLFINGSEGSATVPEDHVIPNEEDVKSNYFKSVIKECVLFGQSVWVGGKVIFTHRKYVWWWGCYVLTLYSHRYLENGIVPQVAKYYFGRTEWSLILLGGSNFGELLGALSVFLFTNRIKSPILWLRLDALLLLIVWYIPYYYPAPNDVKYAWIMAATLIPLGLGSAATDVSLNAHIQSSLTGLTAKNKNISVLGAVSAFLYSSYIILYAIANPLLGKYIDSVFNSTKTVQPALFNTAAIQFTILTVIILVFTCIPKGAISFNPVFVHDESSYVEFDQNRQSGPADRQQSQQNAQITTHF